MVFLKNSLYESFSFYRFSYSYLNSLESDLRLLPIPMFWYLLLIILLVSVLLFFFKNKYSASLPDAFSKTPTRAPLFTYFRHIITLFQSLAISLCLFSLSIPHELDVTENFPKEGLDIVLALDLSGSMRAEDFEPNRLNAAKQLAIDFVQKRENDRIALILFRGQAFSKTPLSTDYDMLATSIDEVSFEDINIQGTAIGNAIGTSINRILEAQKNRQKTTPQSSIIILLTDGENTAGEIEPSMAAQLAKEENIKVYTIAIGREGNVPITQQGFFGKQQVLVKSHVDEELLKSIASITNGVFYRAEDANTLKEIFDDIDRLEKVEIESVQTAHRNDVFYIYLTWATIFFVLSFLMKLTPIGNRLEH